MGERIHGWLAAAALMIVLVGLGGWRWLVSTDARRMPLPAPAPQLRQLLAYAAPLPDTLMIASPPNDGFAVRRDPFADEPVLPEHAVAAAAQVPRRPADEEPRWIVTATMIAGTRRAAVINDVLIYVGESVPGGGRLTTVERDRVVVTDPKGTSHTVTVKEGDS